ETLLGRTFGGGEPRAAQMEQGGRGGGADAGVAEKFAPGRGGRHGFFPFVVRPPDAADDGITCTNNLRMLNSFLRKSLHIASGSSRPWARIGCFTKKWNRCSMNADWVSSLRTSDSPSSRGPLNLTASPARVQ